MGKGSKWGKGVNGEREGANSISSGPITNMFSSLCVLTEILPYKSYHTYISLVQKRRERG